MAFLQRAAFPALRLSRKFGAVTPFHGIQARSFASSFDGAVKTYGPAIASHSDNSVKLEFYALYKQATSGDCTAGASTRRKFLPRSHHPKLFVDRPGMLDMVGRAKYDAWKKLSGVCVFSMKDLLR